MNHENDAPPSFVLKFMRRLAAEDFQTALKMLVDVKDGDGLFEFEKQILIDMFDHFMESLEECGTVYSGDELKILAEVKKILIVYQLENSSYDEEKLKSLIRKTILSNQPLSELIGRPFAFVLDLGDGPAQLPVQPVLNIYARILKDLSLKQAREIQTRQELYFSLLPLRKAYTRHTLESFVELSA